MMTWDPWPIVVLALTVLAGVRPGWVILVLEPNPYHQTSRYSLSLASGGAAMLTAAVWLATQSRAATGFGFWDMPVLALQNPYLRSLPAVWAPPICWLGLITLGAWWLFIGTKGMRMPRDLPNVVRALNEMAICTGLLLWNVTVPETWNHAVLFGFVLQGVYVSYLTGAAVRLALALSSFVLPPAAPPPPGRERRSNSALRRY